MESATKRTSILPVVLMAMTVPIVIQVMLMWTVAVAQSLVYLDKAIVIMMLNVQMDLSVEGITVEIATQRKFMIVVHSKTLV